MATGKILARATARATVPMGQRIQKESGLSDGRAEVGHFEMSCNPKRGYFGSSSAR